MSTPGRGLGRGAYYKYLYSRGRAKRRATTTPPTDTVIGSNPQVSTEQENIFIYDPTNFSKPRGDKEDFTSELRRIDGKGYNAYKDLKGNFNSPMMLI